MNQMSWRRSDQVTEPPEREGMTAILLLISRDAALDIPHNPQLHTPAWCETLPLPVTPNSLSCPLHSLRLTERSLPVHLLEELLLQAGWLKDLHPTVQRLGWRKRKMPWRLVSVSETFCVLETFLCPWLIYCRKTLAFTLEVFSKISGIE